MQTITLPNQFKTSSNSFRTPTARVTKVAPLYGVRELVNIDDLGVAVALETTRNGSLQCESIIHSRLVSFFIATGFRPLRRPAFDKIISAGQLTCKMPRGVANGSGKNVMSSAFLVRWSTRTFLINSRIGLKRRRQEKTFYKRFQSRVTLGGFRQRWCLQRVVLSGRATQTQGFAGKPARI